MIKDRVGLVGERDEVALAERDGALEVFGRAQVLLVDEEADGEACGGGEVFDDVGRAVGRAVVADDQLVGRAGLRRDAVELLPQVAGAVVRAHRDGKFHLRKKLLPP